MRAIRRIRRDLQQYSEQSRERRHRVRERTLAKCTRMAGPQNIVPEDGPALGPLSIIKNGNSSTLQVVTAVPRCLEDRNARAAPQGSADQELFDQSVFVKQASWRPADGAIAAGLTALMICCFLGSWRPGPWWS